MSASGSLWEMPESNSNFTVSCTVGNSLFFGLTVPPFSFFLFLSFSQDMKPSKNREGERERDQKEIIHEIHRFFKIRDH